jgi:diguanylate cyclase (GGDEF)-like protein/PAS domain S-box-containing protein
MPDPSLERRRLASLPPLDVVGTPRDDVLDGLARAAAAACATPVALVCLVDGGQPRLKAAAGLEHTTATPREIDACIQATCGGGPLGAPDAPEDEPPRDGLAARGEPAFRAHAGAPIVLPGGVAIGAVCVMDDAPRAFTPAQLAVLRELAAVAARTLEARSAAVAGHDQLRRDLALAQRVAAVAQHSDDAIIGKDLDSRVTSWNTAAERIFGYAADEMIGHKITRLFPPERLGEEDWLLSRVLAGEAVPQFETVRLRKDGTEVHVSVSLAPIRDAAGTIVAVSKVARDITQRRRHEQLLRESEARYRALVDDQVDLLALSFPNGELKYVNPAFARFFGCTAAEACGTVLLRHAAPADRDAALADFHAAQATDAPVHSERRWTSAGDGDAGEKWLSWTHHALRDLHGKVFAIHSVGRDVTERRATEQSLRASKAKLQKLYEATPAMLHSMDAQGVLVTVSDVWLQRLGYRREEVLGRRSRDFFAPEFVARAAEEVSTALLRDGRVDEVHGQMLRKDGSRMDVLFSMIVERREDGRPDHVLAVVEDVTERMRITRELADKHELLRVTLESIGDAVVTTDARQRVEWLNPVAERMTGWAGAQARGRPVAQVVHLVDHDTRAPVPGTTARCLAEGRTADGADNTVLVSRDGAEYAVEESASPIRASDGALLGAVLVFRDVSQQRRLSQEMSYRAKHDELTGLLNRSEFEQRLDRLLADVSASGQAHSLLYIDLDQFKLVNDACGHAAGDQLLKQIAAVLQSCVRQRDTIARLGGDEFGIVLEHCGTEQARRIADQICSQMEEFRFVHDERRFRLGTSIGLVPLDERWHGHDAPLQAADSAAYAAKEAGRNRVHVWFDTDQAMRARMGQTQWGSRLELALDEDRFELFGQRIAPLAAQGGDARVHVEVLLRMRDTNGTLIAPGAFLPAAERFHVASRIDRWVVRHVFEWIAAQGDLGGVDAFAINLSGQSMGDRAFHRYVTDMVVATKVDARRLCFEITETAAITNMADAAAFVEAMRAIGARIALDDFGAGASSFGYLKSLPVDYLKIDGQFVRDLNDDALDLAAVRCFTEVARVIGVRTVAEFVESDALLSTLRDIGVDYVQGYTVHKPEPLAQAARRPARVA